MPKEKYKYFKTTTFHIGDDILHETSVYIKLPDEKTKNETIVLRGPYSNMSWGKFSSFIIDTFTVLLIDFILGLNIFYKKINSIGCETIKCSELIFKYLMEKRVPDLLDLHMNEEVLVKFFFISMY